MANEFKRYIEEKRFSIHKHVIDEIDQYFQKNKGDILDEELLEIVKDYPLRHSGYTRPSLVLLTAEMFNNLNKDSITASTSMQLSEEFFLIHDDIEDHSTLRRKSLTLHKKYGESIAINAGDIMHMIMWNSIYKIKNRNFLIDTFRDIMFTTAKGQHYELDIVNTVNKFYDIENLKSTYFKIVERKTAYYSVYGCMELGYLSTIKKIDYKSLQILKTLKDLGYISGMTFQIADDLMDFTTKDVKSGKKQYNDLYEGKITLLIIEAYNYADKNEKEIINSIYNKQFSDKTEDDIKQLIEIINKYNIVDYIKEEYVDKNILKLNNLINEVKDEFLLPNNEEREILFDGLNFLMTR